jgi:hypothetical protein
MKSHCASCRCCCWCYVILSRTEIQHNRMSKLKLSSSKCRHRSAQPDLTKPILTQLHSIWLSPNTCCVHLTPGGSQEGSDYIHLLAFRHWNVATLLAGLPDGIFSYQKFQICYILECLGADNLCYILWPFNIFGVF